MLFNLFPKKLETLEDYLIMLIRRPKILFQLDFYRNQQVDFQIGRQILLKDYNVKVDNPKGFVVLLTFNSEKDDNEKNYENFKSSYLFDKSIEEDFLGKSYFLKCNDNIEEITQLINHIQTIIYSYNDDTKHSFAFSKYKR